VLIGDDVKGKKTAVGGITNNDCDGGSVYKSQGWCCNGEYGVSGDKMLVR
jgi:hypothetical protein